MLKQPESFECKLSHRLMADRGRGPLRQVDGGCGLDLKYDDRLNPRDRTLGIQEQRRRMEDLVRPLIEARWSTRSDVEL
ncbi:hypothetical protein AKJ16_DCAP00806 [Drosera capensis]